MSIRFACALPCRTQRADEHMNERNEVQLSSLVDVLAWWGLWVNTSKNPRLKNVEFPGLSLSVEIPKQIALSNIAMRVVVGGGWCEGEGPAVVGWVMGWHGRGDGDPLRTRARSVWSCTYAGGAS